MRFRDWECLPFLSADAAAQMAIDTEMAHACEHAPPRAIIRLYRMAPPAVTIGRHQRWTSVIDEKECLRRGWEWVRRPTGGGALLHQFELNYAVAASHDVFGDPAKVAFRPAFERIMRGLARAIELLGGHPTLSMGRTSPESGKPRAAHGLCEQSLTRFEISVAGKKAVAAAQWQFAGSFLQHGTIYMRAPGPADRFWPLRSEARPSSPQGATWWDTSGLLPDSELAADKIIAGIRDGLAQALDFTWSPVRFDRLSRDRIDARLREWACQNWNRIR